MERGQKCSTFKGDFNDAKFQVFEMIHCFRNDRQSLMQVFGAFFLHKCIEVMRNAITGKKPRSASLSIFMRVLDKYIENVISTGENYWVLKTIDDIWVSLLKPLTHRNSAGMHDICLRVKQQVFISRQKFDRKQAQLTALIWIPWKYLEILCDKAAQNCNFADSIIYEQTFTNGSNLLMRSSCRIERTMSIVDANLNCAWGSCLVDK